MSGLSEKEKQIIAVILNNQGIQPSVLAERLKMGNTMLSDYAKVLEQKGLLFRLWAKGKRRFFMKTATE